MQIEKIINTLASFGERQFEAETKARHFIASVLSEAGITFLVDEFKTYVPKYGNSNLTCDGEVIASKPCGLVSGEIKNADTILSSLISSQKNFYDTNINFNPRCSVISKSNHYGAPALAIAAKDVSTVLQAKTVLGVMEVTKTEHISANILVGNSTNPKKLVVCHYDSIETGAVDNASGVALSLKLIIENQTLLKHTLFIFCGNEELSYDETIYWGHGYREFENTYPELIQSVEKIIVLDSFGFSETQLVTDIDVVTLAFPILSINQHIQKIVLVSGNYEKLMKFYHAENDVPENISTQFFSEAEEHVLKFIS